MGTEKIGEEKAQAAIEAILFAMGDSVELEKIAAALELSKEETRNVLKQNGKMYYINMAKQMSYYMEVFLFFRRIF